MKLDLRKELPLMLVVILPFIYLRYIWNTLPAKVAVHWNIQGEVDRYGDKIELLFIAIMLPLLSYLLFLAMPFIDPKKKIKNMGSKYQSIKTLITILMSGLALTILYFSKNESLMNPNYIMLFVGLLFLILGNYFKTIKANYFIGIKTPWTLESETVWKQTHELAGQLWFVGGLILAGSSLILSKRLVFTVGFLIILIVTLVPTFYSYFIFQKIKKAE